MNHEFLPIIIRYDGLEAEAHMMDLGQLGKSIQGASRLLGCAGSIVVTGNFVKQSQAFSVRVLAGPPQAHCYEIVAFISTLLPAMAPMLPAIQEAAKTAATKALTGIVSYALASASNKKPEADLARDVAIKALEEMGHTSRTAIEAIERVASSQRPAIRLFVSPVGDTCAVARIGDPSLGAISVDAIARAEIDAPEDIEIGNTTEYEIQITEFDLKNHSCKFALRDQSDPEHRFSGEITDPVAQVPKNPYSAALDDQRWIRVLAKAQTKGGELEKIFISDIAQRLLLPSTI